MSTTQYHKLVRDRIPEIIESSGKTCAVTILSDEDYLHMIDAKLDEELAEYHKDQNIEELADLMEVIYAAAKARGYTLEQLEDARAQKAAIRGTFEKKILLKSVFDPTESSNLVSLVIQNKEEIMSKLDVKMMNTYRWLQEELCLRDVSSDQEYRKKFSGYYKMRFVSQEYRDAFFALFEKMKRVPDPTFRSVAYLLYEVDQKHEFSFISKMLHTLNPHKPIFDSQVCEVLRLRHYYQSSFEAKVQQDEKALACISDAYADMKASEEINGMLAHIDRYTPGYQMTDEKKMDFILWALGGILKKR